MIRDLSIDLSLYVEKIDTSLPTLVLLLEFLCAHEPGYHEEIIRVTVLPLIV